MRDYFKQKMEQKMLYFIIRNKKSFKAIQLPKRKGFL